MGCYKWTEIQTPPKERELEYWTINFDGSLQLQGVGARILVPSSQKAPPPVMRIGVHRAVTPGAVAHFEVLADKWANDQCSYMRYGECEPSII
jgi:hypothetical protein